MIEARIKLHKCLIRFANHSKIREKTRRAKDKRKYYMYKASTAFYDIKEIEY
jgi:hypothetical protein